MKIKATIERIPGWDDVNTFAAWGNFKYAGT